MKTKNQTLPHMTTQKLRRKSSAAINNSRWAAYATAGVATALGAATAEAAIHYSGPINKTFNAPPAGTATSYFKLDQPEDSIGPFHFRTSGGNGLAKFSMFGLASASVAAFNILNSTNFSVNRYASKLGSGVNLNGLANFSVGFAPLEIYSGRPNSQWGTIGTGFVGFRFNNGSGRQYGWARIHMDEGVPGNSFTLIDFAWADPGEQIATGQIQGAPAPSEPESLGQEVPVSGSLGLLALGGGGLIAWRKRRSARAVGA